MGSDTTFFIVVTLFSSALFAGAWAFYLHQTNNALKNNITGLEKTVTEIDNQAKIIIKGDMELKLYQEEIEDKLDKLTFLKSIILSSVTLMDKEDLFVQINEKIINDLGFKKGAVLNFATLDIRVSPGCNQTELAALKEFLLHKKLSLTTNFLLSYDNDVCSKLAYALGYNDFLIAPIKGREEIHAVFFVANMMMPVAIRMAEREIFTIVCMYLGQCLDNIMLFEKNYLNQIELEKKITERTNELAKTLKEMESMNRAKSDFISSVSHELRTPLTSVKGFSSLLVAEKFGVLPPEAKLRLEKIDQNVNKLVDMVNVLLDISRIESGKTEVKIAPADIAKLIKETGDFLSPQMQAKHIEFVADVPTELLALMDKSLIERVLINLINNALKFTPENGKIIVSCKEEKEKVIVAVRDTGCGIPKEDMQKLFSEFFRTQLTQNIPGTGLGLSLVKRIIETHKEKIWVDSEVGKGTTFYFSLKQDSNNV
jgi:signal transduction histidine kinase